MAKKKSSKWPYTSARWRRLRQSILSESPLCVNCQRVGRVVIASHCDHITPIEQGGDPWDLDNVQTLCHSCHSMKTRHVDTGRTKEIPIKGVDPKTGCPLDPNHWWNQ